MAGEEITSFSTPEYKAINLACGGKLCSLPGWINADHSPSTKEVMQINLLEPLPFASGSFDVVYHSQFIEHLPMKMATPFLSECYRILKAGGVLRVVTPDLENQVKEYQRNLHEVLRDPGDEQARLRYEWIRLEMLDQLTRHKSGGEMVSFLAVSGWKIGDYLRERLGRSGDDLLRAPPNNGAMGSVGDLVRRIKRKLTSYIVCNAVPQPYRVGRFRLSGESHLCMYDQYLLSKVLAECGFSDARRVNATISSIPGWGLTQLDCDSQGNPDCPASLFMEAVKAPS